MAGAPLFNMFGRPRPYDPTQQPEVPASFPQEAAPMATPQAAPQRQSMFGMFGRGLRQVGGQAKDAILGGEHGRDPNIFDFVLGGFGPSGAMGHVGGIRERALQERPRREMAAALTAARGATDPAAQLEALYSNLPPEIGSKLLMERLAADAARSQALEDEKREREQQLEDVGSEREFEGGQLDRRFEFEGRQGALDRASRERVAGMSSAARQPLSAREEIRIEKASEGAQAARQLRGLAQEFGALNRTTRTGPGSGAFGVGQMLSPQRQRMNQITDMLTPLMRQPGSGTMSDADREMFRNSVPNTDIDARANDAAVAAITQAAQNSDDYAGFLDQYSASGSLQGAEQAWMRYLAANPIYDRHGRVRTDRPGLDAWLEMGGPDMRSEGAPGSTTNDASDEEVMRNLQPGGYRGR